ncbi:MAG: glycosyltransferase [Lentilitoribacter sp.]
MKIFYATYPWAFETPGGGEQQLKSYIKWLPKESTEICLYDPWSTNMDEMDALHFFGCIGGSEHFVNYVRQAGKKIILSSSLWIDYPEKYPIQHIQTMFNLADVIITNSEAENQNLAAHFLDVQHKFNVVYNGVDVDRFSGPIDNLKCDKFFAGKLPEEFCLCVGNIEPRKNQLNMLKSLSGKNINIVLIGHIRDNAYYREILNIPDVNIIYLGAFEHASDELIYCMRKARVFCLPSTLETPGLAALESITSGNSNLVITEVGCTKEYFGDSAYYVDPNSIRNIGDCIMQAMSAPKNPILSENIAQKFSWNAVCHQLLEIYENTYEASKRSNDST